MLFNSRDFLFIFLPATLLGFYALGKAGWQRGAGLWLIAASLFFYGWWNPHYLPLLVGSALFNFGIASWISRSITLQHRQRARGLLIAGVCANLLVLGYFKYAGFVTSNLAILTGRPWSIEAIALPLAISFFTFTQIACLVDAWHGRMRECDLLQYGLFVTFFPHLIAGPIVLYRSLMPQFSLRETYRFQAENFAPAVTLFACGLAKKVLIADGLSALADTVFNGAAQGSPPGMAAAWLGAIAYSLQIYFDFSGYSDMATGLARMFNTQFPLNFNSPYQARDIITFWRCWHISLSTFLRDHLYLPLGGNRKGRTRRYMNLVLTMILGGLWHGAGWTFVIWGAWHGASLCLNHGWRHLADGRPWAQSRGARLSGWALTLLAVIAGWVFFRAGTIQAAFSIFRGMAGVHGWGGGARIGAEELALLGFASGVALFGPNSQELFAVALPPKARETAATPQWRWTPLTATLASLVFVLSVLQFSKISEFLYFQF